MSDTTIRKLSVLLLFVIGCHHTSQIKGPKPEIDIVVDDDGQEGISLNCPDGWTGQADWHTNSSWNNEEQWKQYLKDADRGICVREVNK